jgi:Tol biopolymer transport system component/DNA-binding winged helix-turn-helix (wHTH) protein
VSITPKVFETLVFLVTNAGRTVSREELIKSVWPDTFVEEGNLNYNMSQLRKILGEREPGVPYVQTIPKVGYRFVGEVQRLDPQTAEVATRDVPARKKRYLLIVGLAAAAVAILAFGISVSRPRAPAPASSALGPISGLSRITSYPGDERAPSLSPDGAQVAFSWTGQEGSNRDIYITRIGATTPLRLTTDSAEDDDPAWSPDGSQIAFIRQYDVKNAAIFLIPALGGSERKIYSGQFPRSNYPSARPMLAWTPDGKSIVFPIAEDLSSGSLALLSLETGHAQTLVRSMQQAGLDFSPAISPNGEWLAFTRYHAMVNGQILVQRLGPGYKASGEPVAIPGPGQDPRSPVWSPDSQHLIFNDETRVLEWQPGGQVRLAYALNGRFGGMSASWRPGGARIVAASLRSDLTTWTLPLDPATHAAAGQAARWAMSTTAQEKPYYSPDGRSVALVSSRSGTPEVWVADATGANARQLTRLGAYIIGFTRWSPDGTKIAFHARVPDIAQIYVVDVAAGVPRRLTNSATDLIAPAWSSDGRYLYAAGANVDPRVYRIRVDDGSMEPLFEGRFPFETPDGKRIVYAKGSKFGIFARSLEGDPAKNPEEKLVDDYTPLSGGFEVFRDGLYYSSFTPLGIPKALRYFDYAQRRAIDIAPAPATLGVGLSVSPDQRHLLYSAIEETSGYDLLMLEFQSTVQGQN